MNHEAEKYLESQPVGAGPLSGPSSSPPPTATQELRDELKHAMEEIESRLRFAWRKAWILLDRWEPRLLEYIKELLERFNDFLEQEIQRHSWADRLKNLLEGIVADRSFSELAEKLLGALSQADASDSAAVARWFTDNALDICYLAALAHFRSSVDPMLAKNLDQLFSAVGLRCERKPLPSFPRKEQGHEIWDFQPTQSKSVQVASVQVILRPTRPAAGQSVLAEAYVHRVSGPQTSVGLLRNLQKFLDEELDSALHDELARESKGGGPKELVREFFALCRPNVLLPGEYKRRAFELLNVIWGKLGGYARQAPTAPAATIKSSGVGETQPRNDDELLIGKQSETFGAGSSEITLDASSEAESSPPSPLGAISEEKTVGALWQLLGLWQQFCDELLGLAIQPKVDPAQRRLNFSASEFLREIFGSDLRINYEYVKVTPGHNGLPQVTVSSIEFTLEGAMSAQKPAEPGQLLELDSFWCAQFRNPCKWKLAVEAGSLAVEPGSSFAQVANLPPVDKLSPPEPPSSLEDWRKLLGTWRKLAAWALLESTSSEGGHGSSSGPIAKRFERLGNEISQQLTSPEMGSWVQNLLKIAAGFIQRPEEVRKAASAWGRAFEKVTGVQWFPPIDWDSGAVKIDDWKGAIQAGSITFDYNPQHPCGTVVDVKNFGTDWKKSKVKVSLGQQGQNEYLDAAYRIWLNGKTISEQEQRTVSNLWYKLLADEFLAAWSGKGKLPLAKVQGYLDGLLEKVTTLLAASQSGWSQNLIALLDAIKAWAGRYGFRIIPENLGPGLTWQSLKDDEYQYCEFHFADALPADKVVVEVRKIGWQHPDSSRAAEIVVKSSPPPGFREIAFALGEASELPEEQRRKLIAHLRDWPRKWVSASKQGGEQARKDLVKSFYSDLAVCFRSSLEPAKIGALWQRLRPGFEKLLTVCDLQLWGPRTYDEARDERFCFRVGQVPSGAKNFRVLMPGLKDGNQTVVSATIELYRG